MYAIIHMYNRLYLETDDITVSTFIFFRPQTCFLICFKQFGLCTVVHYCPSPQNHIDYFDTYVCHNAYVYHNGMVNDNYLNFLALLLIKYSNTRSIGGVTNI